MSPETTDLGTRLALVTGAKGWLGASLVEALIQGLPDGDAFARPQPDLRVRCLVLPGQDPRPLVALSDRLEVVEGDLRSVDDCRRFWAGAEGAILFHTAGVIHPRRVSEFYDVNVGGTTNVIDAGMHVGLRRAIVISSNSPCGCNPHRDHLFDEESPYNPYMTYGHSKMLMELAVRQRIDERGLDAVILRPPWFYGPQQPARQTLFFQMIRDGKAPIVGGGQNLRSMAYTDNIVQGMLLAATRDEAAGETFWIADERPYTMHEIIGTVERLLETEFGQKCAHGRLRLPGAAAEVAGLVDASLQRLGRYHQKIHVLSEMNKTIACSVGKARRVLGYHPRISLEEGMRRSLQWTIAARGGI
ncbi:MAG: NAD-dependent epimerase/dehydratase family protein [Acidobacteriota bacterium]